MSMKVKKKKLNLKLNVKKTKLLVVVRAVKNIISRLMERVLSR